MNIYVSKLLISYKNILEKCDDQQQYKTIIEAATVSNYEGFTNNIPITPI